jgi:PAS domain S-box-containing protein
MSAEPLRVLVLEDRPDDAELIVEALSRAGFEPRWIRVEHERDYRLALDDDWDIILSDFNLPNFDALRAIQILNERRSKVPLIVVSGSIGEEVAVDLLRQGAADYLLKDRLGRLPEAVRRALEDRRLRERERTHQHALAATEERMRFALEAAGVGVWEADLATGTVQWSRLLEQLHGLAPGGFAGRFDAFLELIHADDRAVVGAEIERATRDRDQSRILYRCIWADGGVHWLRGIGRTIYDPAGRPLRAAGVGLDITERQNLEERYRQSQRMESIALLAGGIAHDFNNLLTAILGFTEVAAEQLEEASPIRPAVDQIRQAAHRAESLTRQLLAYSRQQILEPRVLDLREVVLSFEPMLRRLIGEHIDVVVHATPPIGNVKADRGQIEQVILNLAVNARDAMPAGGTLSIELSETVFDEEYSGRHAGAAPGRTILLAVSDTGSGMDAATVARVFEPFFTTKEQGHGTGLGLATVYGIVKQSGGHIWAYSEPGVGTTLKVYLPCVDAAADVPAVVAATSGALTGHETVLVVEDEEALRDLIQLVLERLGYRVLVAATPAAAFKAAEAQPDLHLLLTDIVLPKMNGREIAERLRQARPALRVLFMSGYADNAAAVAGRLPDRAPFLQKPFTPNQLATKVRAALQ